MFELVLIVVGLILAFETWREHREQRRALRTQAGARPRPLASYPSVSVIRPIRGLDAGAEGNIAAALDHGYPGDVETIFVFDDADEPALPLVRRAIGERRAAGRAVDARVAFSGQPPRGRTGKLNAMIVGLREARNEVIVFADSDIRPDHDALRALVETLMTSDDTGSAFAPVAVQQALPTAGDVGYALMLNGLYGPAAAASTVKNGGELPFIMGQFMAFRRQAIAAIGGLECADGQLVDDMYLGSRINAAGYRNRVSPHPVPIVQEGLSIREFARVFVRWITFSRSGLPGREFKLASWLRGVVYWVGLLGALGALLAGHLVPALVLLLAPLGVSASINRLHREIGGAELPLRHQWVAFGVLLSAPMVYASVFLQREVRWRGRSYELGSDSRLATSASDGVSDGSLRHAA
jgi:ceramide glucosyltransferase